MPRPAQNLSSTDVSRLNDLENKSRAVGLSESEKEEKKNLEEKARQIK